MSHIKLDSLDMNILWYLDREGGIPVSHLANKLKVSKQNLSYRIQRLQQQEVILGFVAVIDIHRLGFQTFRIYFRYRHVDSKAEEKILNYLKENKNVLWLVSIVGAWDLETIIVARSGVHFQNILKQIKKDLGKYFIQYNLSMAIVTYHFRRDYLMERDRVGFQTAYYGFEPKMDNLDKLDLALLTELALDCRQSLQQLGEKTNVSYQTAKQRIRRMEKQGIIQFYRAWINLAALGRTFYKSMLSLNNPSERQEKKLYKFCASHNFVVFLVEVLGEWQLEVEAEVESNDRFVILMRDMRNSFPNLIAQYSFLHVTKEHKLNYFPTGKELGFETIKHRSFDD